MRIGIIGGSGKTGNQFFEFFSNEGLEVIKIGRKTENYQSIVESCEVIILSVPIDAIKTIINQISEYNLSDKLIINFSSIMSHGWEELQNLEADVCCIHPMFGPQLKIFAEQNIILAPKIENVFLEEIIRLFEKESATVSYSSIEEHDKLMALIQGLSQFSSISLASTIAHQKILLSKLLKFSSITFRMNLGTIERILSQDAELWRNIQFLNPYFEEILESYNQSILEITKIVKEKRGEEFDATFNEIKGKWEKETVKGRVDLLQTSLVLDAHEDRVGLLIDMLTVFKNNDVNLAKIKSKKSKTRIGTYMFDVVLDTKDEKVLEKIKKELEELKVSSVIV